MTAPLEQSANEVSIGVVLECLQECQELAVMEVTHRTINDLYLNICILQDAVEVLKANLPERPSYDNVVYL